MRKSNNSSMSSKNAWVRRTPPNLSVAFLPLVPKWLPTRSSRPPERALALRRGIFTNIVYKDPTSLAYRGAKTLGDYLLWGRTPTVPVQKGAVEMVFASNVDRYCELAGI